MSHFKVSKSITNNRCSDETEKHVELAQKALIPLQGLTHSEIKSVTYLMCDIASENSILKGI